MAENNYQWLDRKEYPFRSNYFEINGQRMHYIDEGTGETLLFVHGTPSWSFDFRHVIGDLGKSHRCVAIDHIGFGLSDKPARYDYTTINHARTLEQFILHKDLRNITLIVHDFGGPIGLHFAINHPERVSRLVILNSWLWSSEADPDFVKMKGILKSPLLPFLYRYLNFSPRFILPKAFGSTKPSRKVLAHYAKPFANSAQRNGALAFARSLLNDQAWFEALWAGRTSIATKPTLLIWGMKDPILKEKLLEKFQGGFPHAQTVILADSGHFPQEEAPQRVSAAIRDFTNPAS